MGACVREQALKDKDPHIDQPGPSSGPAPAPQRIRKAVSLALPIAAALIIVYVWWPHTAKPVAPELPNPQAEPASQAATPSDNSPSPHDLPPGHPGASDSDSLLQQMGKDSAPDTADLSGPVATTAQLESQYSIIADSQEQLNQIRNEVTAAAESKNKASVQQGVERGKPLMALLNARLAAFQKDLTVARKARPDDPIVQWLTGELFIIVGGEPEDILPYFNRAVAAHLDRPHLFVSLAKVEFDLNHFQEAYRDAAKAVAEAPKSQDAWEIYARAGFAMERFVEVLKNIDLTFPGDSPPWASLIRRSAEQLQKSWLRELSQRLRDQKKGDLPIVRLVIEHRKFAAPADGNAAESIKVVGRGDVDIELFEDQAPATVSNFIHLVETGFYNGTSFYWAEAGHMVVGGDPNTKNADPADDGIGGSRLQHSGRIQFAGGARSFSRNDIDGAEWAGKSGQPILHHFGCGAGVRWKFHRVRPGDPRPGRARSGYRGAHESRRGRVRQNHSR